VLGQLHRVSTTDAVTGSGDQRDFPVEQTHARLSCR
jgi:hypothetical protein